MLIGQKLKLGPPFASIDGGSLYSRAYTNFPCVFCTVFMYKMFVDSKLKLGPPFASMNEVVFTVVATKSFLIYFVLICMHEIDKLQVL